MKQVICIIGFLFLISVFSSCFDDKREEEKTGNTGTLTVYVNGAQSGIYISFGVFETGTTFDQMIDLENYDPEAWGRFLSDGSGNGSSPAYDAVNIKDIAHISEGSHVLGVLQDSDANGDPSGGELFAMKDITIDGDAEITVTGAEFTLTVP